MIQIPFVKNGAQLEKKPMAEAMIHLEDLWKVYQMGSVKVEALRGVNLDIQEGEFLAIMGASGSGKSTVMNILGCLDRPSRGDYYLDGIDIRTRSEDQLCRIRNEKIGFVFQSFNLIARTSALKNVALPLVYAKDKQRSNRYTRAMELLDKVGIADRAHHVPNELSGGQRQRVAIARALINNPQIILADEPTGNLDSFSTKEIMDIFVKLHRVEKRTIIIVTHEREIGEMADRIVTFKDGQIIRDERRQA